MASSPLGTVTIQVEQVREIPNINYCLVCVGNDERQSKVIAAKNISDQRWDDTFKFEIWSNQQSDFEVTVVKKKTILKDKPKAHARIPIPIGDVEETKHDWFPLYPLPKKSMQKNVGIPSKVGEVRVSVHWVPANPKVEKVLRGFVFDNKWTKNGGKLTNHSTWINNPQYLLSVADNQDPQEVTIKLHQPEDKDNRMSFYILKYNQKEWKGRKMLVYSDQDSVRTDNMAPALFGESPESTLELESGDYVIIPSSEDPEYVGPFTLNVWIKTIDSDDKIKKVITVSELGGVASKDAVHVKDWHQWSTSDTWDEDTAGGGNIDGLRWRINHQYLIRPPEKQTDFCVVLGQPEKELSIGLYVIKYNGYGRRQIEYRDEVANSGQFKFLPTVGVARLSIGPSDSPLLIMPCTHTTKLPEDKVTFEVSVFSSEPLHVTPNTKSWEHTETCKTLWDVNGGSAGGSPNNDTFLKNPQFVIIPPANSDVELLIDLTVPDASHSIGFVVIKRPRVEGDHSKPEIFEKYERISEDDEDWQDDVFAQPKGWEKRVSLSVHAVGTKETNASHVFYVIPATFEANVNKPFTVTVYSDEQVQFLQFVGTKLQTSDPEEKSALSMFSPKSPLLKSNPSRRVLEQDLTVTADTDLNAPFPATPVMKKDKKKKKSKKEKKTKEEVSDEEKQ